METYNDKVNQDKLKDLLCKTDDGIIVCFTKVNGEEREMLCSLNPKHIPEVIATGPKLNKDGTPRAVPTPSDEVLRVVDVRKNEWRSFRWDSITYVEC